jgi:hypothetical protein
MEAQNHFTKGQFQLPAPNLFSHEEVFVCLRMSVLEFVKNAWHQGVVDETMLTQLLILELADNALTMNFPFHFMKENRERKGGDSPSNDIAAYQVRKKARGRFHQNENVEARLPIVRFEAKRLDSNLRPISRMKEYVIGNYTNPLKPKTTGGMERFKNLKHAPVDNQAALIGYMQSDNVNDWFTKVNTWVGEEITQSSNPSLVWKDEDKLTKTRVKNLFLDEFTSYSQRTDGTHIHLRHFWIRMK